MRRFSFSFLSRLRNFRGTSAFLNDDFAPAIVRRNGVYRDRIAGDDIVRVLSKPRLIVRRRGRCFQEVYGRIMGKSLCAKSERLNRESYGSLANKTYKTRSMLSRIQSAVRRAFRRRKKTYVANGLDIHWTRMSDDNVAF